MSWPSPGAPAAAARIHGGLRATVASCKKSVHAASGVVSAGAGRLWGFIVVSPGSSGTMTVYDNASAASGRKLRSVAAAELVRGAFIYCGPNGIAAAAGIYVALGGSTAPIVLALFEGSYPTVAHSGTVRYFDGTDGNDAWDGTAGTYQGASVGPKKTWTTGYTSGDWHMYCKRGTVIDVTDTALIHLGTDWLVEDYGDASLAKPVLQLSATKTNNFVFNGTSGIIEFRNIRIVSLLATRKSGGAFSAGRGARVIVKDCEANNFTAGAIVGGAYSVVDNLTTTQCTLGVSTGSTAAAAANYSLTMNSNLTADSDVYSAHDGTGTGTGNVCVACTITLDPAFVSGTGGVVPENCVDINNQFNDTLIAFNVCYASNVASSYPISGDVLGDGVSVIANLVYCGSQSGVRLNSPNWVVTGNAIVNVGTVTAGSGCIHIEATATGAKVYGNYCYMNAASQRSMVVWVAGASSGEFKNNILESANDTQRIFLMNAGCVAGWGAGTFATNDYYAPAVTGTTTFADIVGGGGAQTLASFSATYAAGSELNVAPALDASYRPPGGSALIGAGTALGGVCYLGFAGPFWNYGTPTVGATDSQWSA